MKWVWLSPLVALVLSACATSYRPPSGPVPASWSGDSGFIPAGETKPFLGIRHANDPILSTELHFVRTGVLADTIETKSPYGGVVILPKGSNAYAANYSLFIGSNYAPMRNVQVQNNPIEWCVVVPQGFDGKGRGSQTACIFYESGERARYMQDFTMGGFAFDPFMGGGDAGMPGPVPVILEQPVDFGVRVTREVRVMKVEAGGVQLGVVLSDGTNFRVKERRFVRWNAAGEIGLGSLRLRRMAADPTAVEVTMRSGVEASQMQPG